MSQFRNEFIYRSLKTRWYQRNHIITIQQVDLPQFTEPVPLLPNEDDAPHEKEKGENASIHRNMIKRFNQHSIMVSILKITSIYI